jgi:MerR family transcriptional regulator, heat shock protein HspR
MSSTGDTGGYAAGHAGGDLASTLDDPDYPAYTTGQAAAALGVQQAFLRSLDAARAVRPQRSAGGHRRYSRRQLLFAQRIRELFDQGHTLTSALRILSLEDELAAARALITRLRRQLGQGGPRDMTGDAGDADGPKG